MFEVKQFIESYQEGLTTNQRRAIFEAWADNAGYWNFDIGSDLKYENQETQAAWVAWQAGRASL